MPDHSRSATLVASPLTSGKAVGMRISQPGGSWLLFREADGLTYATAQDLSPRTADERAEMILAARHFAREAATVVFLSDATRSAFARWVPSLYVGKVEPWIVRA